MSDGKFLSKETTELVANILYEKVKEKLKWWMRGIVKQGLKLALSLLNKGADKIIPDSVDIHINLAIQYGYAKELDKAVEQIAMAENILIDIPNIDEAQEYKTLHANTYAIVQNIKAWIDKRKTENI